MSEHRLLLKTSKSSNRSQVLISLHTPYRHAMQADCWEEGADFVVCYLLLFSEGACARVSVVRP